MLAFVNFKKALEILLENMDKLPIKSVVEKLNTKKLYLHYVRLFTFYELFCF